ncbi:MAG: hypothetical protein AAFW70_11335 [Cyanobacteria bacterium J06635_10]
MVDSQDSWSEYLSLVQLHWARYIKFEYEKNPEEVKRRVDFVCERYPEMDKAWKLKKLFECHAFNVKFLEENQDLVREYEEKARKRWKNMRQAKLNPES